MGDILKFKTRQAKSMEEFLDNVKKQVLEENIDNMIIVSKCEDGTVMVGYTGNLDWGKKQELVGHMQVDVINEMIKANYVTPE